MDSKNTPAPARTPDPSAESPAKPRHTADSPESAEPEDDNPRVDEDTTDYSTRNSYESTDDDSDDPPPQPKPPRQPRKWADDGEHIDLEAAVAEASDLPVAVNQLEALLAQTPPELRKVLEDEFSAEFLGPIVVDTSKLD